MFSGREVSIDLSHLMQHGPSFPHPIDIFIDVASRSTLPARVVRLPISTLKWRSAELPVWLRG